MQLTRNAKGTIGFIIAVVFGQIWSAITPVYNPPWEPWPPIVPFMSELAVPFMVNYFRPVLMGLAGLAIFWVWEGKREGYLVALLLSAIATGFGVMVTFFNAITQEWLGLFTAVIAVAFPAIMALWYSFQGYRNYGSEA
jgi:hypothetical protein